MKRNNYRYIHRLTGKIIESPFKFRTLKPFIECISSDNYASTNRHGTLIIRRALGDVLMLLPPLEVFASVYGLFTFATDEWLLDFIRRQSFIGNAIDFKNINLDEYQRIINLEQIIDTLPIERRKHRTIIFGDILRSYMSFSPEVIMRNYFLLTDMEKHQAKKILLDRGRDKGKRLIALAPVTKSYLRNWEGEIDLIDSSPEYQFVVFHNRKLSKFDNIHNVINLSGETNLMQLAAFCSQCDASIVPDSGPMHVMGMLKVPTIAIFGRVIPPQNRIAYYDSIVALESTCDLLTDKGMKYCFDNQFCSCTNKKEYRMCMKQINVEMVKQKLDFIWE